MALIARVETHEDFPRGLDRRRHDQINDRESDYSTRQRHLIEVPLFKTPLVKTIFSPSLSFCLSYILLYEEINESCLDASIDSTKVNMIIIRLF